MRRRHARVAAVFALGLGLVACAGDDADRPDDATEPPASDAVAETTHTASQTTGVASETTEVETMSFSSAVSPVTADELAASWTPGIGCAPPDDLVVVTVSHHGFDGAVHDGRIVVAASVADGVVDVFSDLFDEGFPIESMAPVADFDGDDDASMAANNSSGYNCRTVAGTTTLSQHALGLAIDINPLINPWVHDGRIDPPEGAAYADRSASVPGMIRPGDAVVSAFAARGWAWGGDWSDPDYQHFYFEG